MSFAKVAQSSPKTRNLEKSGNEKNNRNFFLLITNLHLGGGASSISPFLILGSQNIFFRCWIFFYSLSWTLEFFLSVTPPPHVVPKMTQKFHWNWRHSSVLACFQNYFLFLLFSLSSMFFIEMIIKKNVQQSSLEYPWPTNGTLFETQLALLKPLGSHPGCLKCQGLEKLSGVFNVSNNLMCSFQILSAILTYFGH